MPQNLEQPTPPGFNKVHRDVTKILLAATSLFLLVGRVGIALLCSAGAVLFIKQGTMSSAKNLKWMALSLISFVGSLCSWAFVTGEELLNGEKAYELKFKLWFRAKFIELVWGGILALFLLSSYTSGVKGFVEPASTGTPVSGQKKAQ